MSRSSEQIIALISRLRKQGPVVWLDSRMQEHRASQCSWIAAYPRSVISMTNDPDVWTKLKAEWTSTPSWWFGYLGYDMKNGLEDLSSTNPALIDAPDCWFMDPGLLIRIDHQTDTWTWIRGQEYQQELEAELQKNPPLDTRSDYRVGLFTPSISKQDYLDRIKQIQDDIFEGLYYEMNFTYPLRGAFEGDSLRWYNQLQHAGPVPFGAYLDIGDVQVACLSPERFLQKKKTHLISQPIKGTRGKGETPEADRQIRRELQHATKDRAENLMIVDLVRNDFNRIAIPSTVSVDRLFEIQSFPTVHQMVSSVHAEVEAEVHPVEILAACFPMGSMTGAPKIEVMKRIEQLENYRRGIYSGAIGYLNPEGDFDFNVVIRTAIIQQNQVVYPVGGAITSDSDPEEEWQETIIKARALAQQIE
ncbi:MAG: aminodeoxychorismate synthase component I [Bacteroidota bacterium]